MDKDRLTFINMQVKFSNTLGKPKKMISLHTLYIYVCCVWTHAQTRACETSKSQSLVETFWQLQKEIIPLKLAIIHATQHMCILKKTPPS